MSANGGNLAISSLWSDVFLDLDEDEVGSAVAVALSEDAASDIEWECRIYAKTRFGRFCVGSLRTRPPALGEVPSRLIATAYFPGAVGWDASFRAVSGTLTVRNPAKCDLSSSPVAAGTLPGVTPVLSGPSGPNARRSFVRVAPGVSLQLTTINGSQLYAFDATLELAAAPGTNTFVQLFDKATAPAAADVPFWAAHVGQAAAGSPPDVSIARYLAGIQGRPIRTFLWAASSSTLGTLTPAAVAFDAYAELALP